MNPGFILRYGGVQVPWTASWSAEEEFSVASCPYAGGKLAMWQPSQPGEGKPLFAKPHAVRQRRAMAELRCDLCSGRLDGRTKVSLSQESPRQVAGIGFVPLAVEPLLHPDCADLAVTLCPSLTQQAADGRLRVRQVFACRLIASYLTPEAIEEFTGRPVAGVVGHLKLAITQSIDRDRAWLVGRRS